MVGIGALAVSLSAATWCVIRLAVGGTAADLAAFALFVLILTVWVVLPNFIANATARDGRSAVGLIAALRNS